MPRTLSQKLRVRFSTPAAAGIAIALAIGGIAGAITSTDFTYSPGRAGYLSIHPMDMVDFASGDIDHAPKGKNARAT
jgi:hypothetical protein